MKALVLEKQLELKLRDIDLPTEVVDQIYIIMNMEKLVNGTLMLQWF